jgi:thiamine transport system permease protein
MDGDGHPLMLGKLWLLIPLVFLALFFFYPLGAILQLSLLPDGRPDLGGFERLVTVGYLRGTLWFTVWQAVLSTALTLALAIPGAHVFARYEFPGKSALLALATLPFVLPTVVVAVAFTALVGPRSTLNHWLMDIFSLEEPPIRLQRTLTLIFIAHVFYNYAIALRIISSFWATQNQRIQEAARMLGASPLTVFRRVTLPLLMPAIAAAGTLVYIFSFTSFGVILLLGNARHATLEVEIYQQSLALFNLPLAGALALAQLTATLLMMVVYTRLQRHITQPLDLASARTLTRKARDWRERAWIGVNLLVISVLIFAPLVALVERAFTVGMDGPSFRYFSELTKNPRGSITFVPPIEALGNSLQIALVATVCAVILGTLAAYLLIQPGRWARWLDPIFMLPLATSAVTLGFGFIIALDEPPLNLRDSFWILPIAHTLIGMPFVVRAILPSLRGIPPSMREAAAVMGASDGVRWWRIDLPLIARGLLVGATFAFTISMGEFGAAVFIARGREPTMPIVIFRLLGEPGIVNFGQALAMSALLMMVCALSFVLIERLNRAVIGEF